MALKDLGEFPRFALCYAFLALLALVNIFIIFFFPKAHQYKKTEPANHTSIHSIIKKSALNPQLYLAILTASIGYGLMNFVMIQSSLQMNHTHMSFDSSTFAIQLHVLAMFIPSFFTGRLINKIGHIAVINLGLLFFITSFALNTTVSSYSGFMLSLIILGIAWNFSYVGGSSLLTKTTNHSNRKEKWQGLCDTSIAFMTTLGAFLPSILFNTLGWFNTNIMAVLISIIPMLLFATLKAMSKVPL